MAIVVTVAQQKGGAGKTTLVAQLAAALAATRRVAALDVDPQASLMRWHAARKTALTAAAAGLTVADCAGWRLAGEIARLGRSHDVVLIDSPPHAETEARLAVRAADLVLVPVQPSPLDLWATAPTLAMAAAERKPVRVVLNRAPARGRLLEATRAELARAEAPVLDAALGNRSAFAKAMQKGLGVTESAPKGLAAQEVRTLVAELSDWLGSA
ncbi:MAG: ParA family partition ATPase [Acetobacteraceae bacterium]|nr:ParA family partition ATPase [Acetobacteraceae bacterium]